VLSPQLRIVVQHLKTRRCWWLLESSKQKFIGGYKGSEGA